MQEAEPQELEMLTSNINRLGVDAGKGLREELKEGRKIPEWFSSSAQQPRILSID